jgi:molecular chaperone GrpE (heat shock protein)
MKVCNRRHPEICHEGSDCPICDLILEKLEKIEELSGQLYDFQRKAERLQQERDNFESRLKGMPDHEL